VISIRSFGAVVCFSTESSPIKLCYKNNQQPIFYETSIKPNKHVVLIEVERAAQCIRCQKWFHKKWTSLLAIFQVDIISRYRWPLLYADILSAISCTCNQNYDISEERILLFTNAIGLVICKFVICKPFFRSLSIAYNEGRLYIQYLKEGFYKFATRFKVNVWYLVTPIRHKIWCQPLYGLTQILQSDPNCSQILTVKLYFKPSCHILFSHTFSVLLQFRSNYIGSIDQCDYFTTALQCRNKCLNGSATLIFKKHKTVP